MSKQAKQRIIAWCLSIALLIGMVPTNAFAIDDLSGESDIPIPIVESNDIWDGSVASGFARGTGTESDPYIIETAEQLAYLSSSVNGDGKTLGSGITYAGKFIKLANDIYLNDITNCENWDKAAPTNSWTAIGDGDAFAYNPFSGTFDGDGHTISGIYVVGDKYCGLFGYNDCDSTVKNVNVINSYLYSHEEISTEDGIYLCSVVGGIVVSNYGTIDNCAFSGAIFGDGNATLGGIAGNSFGKIKNCINNGTISGIDGGGKIGGIVGNSCENAKDGGMSYIINCINNGTISGNSIDREGLYCIGGIAGSHEVYNDEGSTVRNCRNTGTIKVAQYDSKIGGIIGHLLCGTVECCRNSGKIFIEDGGNGSSAGGIVGAAFSYYEDEPLITVKNCYNTGDVTSDAGCTYVCGIVGDNDADVINCYNSGTVYGYYIAAITEGDAGATTNCYYLAGKASGFKELTTIGTSLTDVQMKKQASYTNWDFEKVWDIKENESYPILRCFAESESTAGIWDGSIATGFASGTGTEGDPYIIETEEQLAFLASSVNSGTSYYGKFFKLAKDIVLNDTSNWENWDKTAPANTWTAIGTDDPLYYNSYIPFCGIFDGDGHIVSGIYINTTEKYQGLFGVIRQSSTVKNLGIEKSYIKGREYVGGVVGYAYESSVTCCYNTGIVIGTVGEYMSDGDYVGGVVGCVYDATVSDCYNTGNITGCMYIGGVTGSNNYGYINDCYNTGNINGKNVVGGVVGSGNAVINCYNEGNVTGSSTSSSSCFGGIAASGYASNCYNAGNVTVTAKSFSCYVGGIVGKGSDYSKTVNCYNTGNLTCTIEFSSGKGYIGGVAGSGKIENCYSIGKVTCTVTNENAVCYIGGVMGYNNSGNNIAKDCYYLNTCVENPTNTEGTALTVDKMKTQNNFNNWNFNAVWEIGFDKTYPYPTLRCFGSKIHNYELTFKDGDNIITSSMYASDTKMICKAPYIKQNHDFVYYVRDDGVKYYPGEIIMPEQDAVYYAVWSTNNTSPNVWNGSIDTEWNGDGTKNNPYQIGTAAELAGLAQNVNVGNDYEDKYFVLISDILLNDGGENFSDYIAGKNIWVPIGISNSFRGSFDGNYHTINGIYINSNNDYQGLFGKIGNARIKNVSIINSYIKGNDYIGGVVGEQWNSEITNCHNSGIVYGRSSVGGIVGYNEINGTISNCTNSGCINGNGNETVSTGGICGYNIGKITNCTNSGKINAVCTDFYSTNSMACSGGIVGNNAGVEVSFDGETTDYYGSVEFCSNNGDINGTVLGVSNYYNAGGVYAGGIVGGNFGDAIKNCNNTGNVNGFGNNDVFVGGVTGASNLGNYYNILSGTINNCYNIGNLFAESIDESKRGIFQIYIGGIAGAGLKNIEESYNIGKIETKRNCDETVIHTGEICAFYENSNNCYYLENTIKDKYDWCPCGTALTTEQMKQKESFVGFDFNNTWDIGMAKDYDYPTIKLYPDFEYILKDGKITIIKYKGTDKDVRIPDTINGYPVVAIAQGAFADNSDIESVFIPTSVVAIDTTAFNNTNLTIWCYENSYATEYASQEGIITQKLVHNHNYRVEIINPTCTESGYTVYTCDGCGETYRADETKPLGHHYVVDSYVAETEDEPCYTLYKCDRDGCGDTYKKYEEKPKRTPTLNGQITTREITDPEEMKKCGIDTNNPDNNVTFEYKYEATYVGSTQQKSITVYTNSKGKIVGYGGYSGYALLYNGGDIGYGYGGGSSGGSGGASLSGSVWYYDSDTDTAIQPLGTNGDPNNPSYYYLKLNGYGGILKQMFEVTLEVQNFSDELWYEECKAEIILPDGLSTAAMFDSSSNTVIQSINDNGVIEKNGSGSATWYIRGDKAGIFDIEAKVTGKIYPEPTDDFELLFKTNEPIVIDDVKDCIQLDIYNVPQVIKNGQIAEIEVRLTNISNRILNHVVLGIIGGEEMVVEQLEPEKTVSATKKVTFNFSSSSKEEIEYYFINSFFVCNLNFPYGGVHFAEIEDGEFDFDISAYEESDFVNEVKNLTVSKGSFSWEKANRASLNGIEKTNYDKLYLKLSVSLKANQSATNVTAKLTAPEGFSFDPFEMVSEKAVIIDYIAAKQTYVYPEDIILYPIYLAEPVNYVFVNGKIMAEGFDTSTKPVLVFNVTENKEQGRIDLRNSFTTKGIKTFTYSLDMDISGFEHSSSQYDLELAKLSVALSAATYQIKTMESTFENLGFSNVKLCNYNEQYDQIVLNPDIVACAFATKKIIVDNKIYTVIAVAIRGTVEREWYSNVNVGQGDIHEGFFNGYSYVSTQLAGYYSELKKYSDISIDNTKVLITGHSRGGAVADLLATELNDNGDLTTGLSVHSGGKYANSDSIYTYTFAAPNTVKEKYRISLNNVFNIISECDGVPHVPGSFVRSGVDLSVGLSFTDIGSAWEYDKMIRKFNDMFASQDSKITFVELNAAYIFLYDYIKTKNEAWVDEPISQLYDNAFTSSILTNNYALKVALKLLIIAIMDMTTPENMTIGQILVDTMIYPNSYEKMINPNSYEKIVAEYAESKEEHINNFIYSNHCIESYIAWLYSSEKLSGNSNTSRRYFELHCPVDVEVYNGDNELICRIVNNEVVYENGCHCVVDGDRKYFMVDGENYTLKINGYDEGVMNIDLFEFDAEGNVSRFVNYANVPVVKDKSSTFTIGDKPEDGTAEYSLSLYDDTDFAATKDVSGDNIENVNVKVTVTNRGFVSGNGTYIAGQSIVLTAEEFDSEFIGWYLGDRLLSTEKTYCFVCNADIELEARFENIPYPTVSGTIKSFSDTDGEITVSLIAGGTVIDKVTVTDGKYSFKIPVNGTYTLEFAKENHATRRYEITVDNADVTQNAKIHLIGDINGDGKVNITDVNKANAHASKSKLLIGYDLSCADVNGDGNVNITDVNKINAHANKSKYLW